MTPSIRSLELRQASEDASLENLLRLSMRYKGQVFEKEILEKCFNPFFTKRPNFSGLDFKREVRKSLGFYPSHEMLRLLKQWNEIAPTNKKIDSQRLTEPYKQNLRGGLKRFMGVVNRSSFLHYAFDQKWKKEVAELISKYDGLKGFGTDSHTIFIGFIQEERREYNFLEKIDLYISKIYQITHRKAILLSKIKKLRAHLSNYLGTAFELMVVGPWVLKGYVEDYEPIIPSSGKRAEALVNVDGFKFLLEATTSQTGRALDQGGAFDPRDSAKSIASKLFSKVEQLKQMDLPIFIFYNPHVGTFEEEVKMGIDDFLETPNAAWVLGVAVAYDYRAPKLEVFENAKFRPPKNLMQILEKVYPISALKDGNLK